MFDLPYRRWLDAAHLIVIGAGAYIANSPKAELGLVGGLLAASGFVMIAGNEWGCMVNKSKELSPDQRLVPESELRIIGAAKLEQKYEHPGDGWKATKRAAGFAFNQTLAPVKIDQERKVAQILNTQRLSGLKMDISETFWVREKHWDGSRDSFIAFRGKWEYYKIVGKRGDAGNSRFEIMNEGAIERIANGSLKLPTPPNM